MNEGILTETNETWTSDSSVFSCFLCGKLFVIFCCLDVCFKALAKMFQMATSGMVQSVGFQKVGQYIYHFFR